MYVNCKVSSLPEDSVVRLKYVEVLTVREVNQIYIDGDLTFWL
jgi:hypothetical protein